MCVFTYLYTCIILLNCIWQRFMEESEKQEYVFDIAGSLDISCKYFFLSFFLFLFDSLCPALWIEWREEQENTWPYCFCLIVCLPFPFAFFIHYLFNMNPLCVFASVIVIVGGGGSSGSYLEDLWVGGEFSLALSLSLSSMFLKDLLIVLYTYLAKMDGIWIFP